MIINESSVKSFVSYDDAYKYAKSHNIDIEDIVDDGSGYIINFDSFDNSITSHKLVQNTIKLQYNQKSIIGSKLKSTKYSGIAYVVKSNGKYHGKNGLTDQIDSVRFYTDKFGAVGENNRVIMPGKIYEVTFKNGILQNNIKEVR